MGSTAALGPQWCRRREGRVRRGALHTMCIKPWVMATSNQQLVTNPVVPLQCKGNHYTCFILFSLDCSRVHRRIANHEEQLYFDESVSYIFLDPNGGATFVRDGMEQMPVTDWHPLAHTKCLHLIVSVVEVIANLGLPSAAELPQNSGSSPMFGATEAYNSRLTRYKKKPGVASSPSVS